MGVLRGLRDQGSASLQRLAQPYFLPLEESSSLAVFAAGALALLTRCGGAVTLLACSPVWWRQRQPDSGSARPLFLRAFLNGSPRSGRGRSER